MDDTHLIAALAVFSHEANNPMRRAIRGSWWPSVTNDTAKFFLLRGRELSSPAAVAAEARVHGDLLLINRTSSLPRSIGPLTTLHAWYECASRLLPTTRFFGKADVRTTRHTSTSPHAHTTIHRPALQCAWHL
jgi:hypothetical protein